MHLSARRKLSEAQIIELRERRHRGETLVSLSRAYAISDSHISSICSGKSAGNIGGPVARGAHPTGQRRRLSCAQIVEMRERRAKGEALRILSRDYGLSNTQISVICRGQAAVNLGGPRSTRPKRL